MPSLANCHRPKRFKDVIGQKTEVDLLRTIIKDSWRPTAIIFQGPFGCGKTTLARLMARALLCEKKDEEGEEGTEEGKKEGAPKSEAPKKEGGKKEGE